MKTPDPQFQVVDPAMPKADEPKVVIQPSPAPIPPAAVTDDDTAEPEEPADDERQRQTETMRISRPVSWPVRIAAIVGAVAVLLVGYGFYRSFATPGRAGVGEVAAPGAANPDSLYHWSKDTQGWINGTLLPDQEKQWKEIDALKAELASVKKGGTTVTVPMYVTVVAVVVSLLSLLFSYFMAAKVSRLTRRRDPAAEQG